MLSNRYDILVLVLFLNVSFIYKLYFYAFFFFLLFHLLLKFFTKGTIVLSPWTTASARKDCQLKMKCKLDFFF